MGEWDKIMRSLVASCPQAFVELVLNELHIEKRGLKVLARLDSKMQGYDVEADALLNIELADEGEVLVHFEFQSKPDTTMPDRQLEYCFRARQKHGYRPIISCVIHLRSKGTVQEPPHYRALKSGRKLMVFDYLCCKLYEEEAEKLLALRQPAILPLTLLTKGGASRTIITRVFNELLANGLHDLLPVTNLLAGLVLQDNQEMLVWLEKEYHNMMEFLKESPAYHWMTDDARAEGLAEGLEDGLLKGRAEGEADGLRRAIARLMDKRFPGMSVLMQKQLALVQHVASLEKLMDNVFDARTPDEVERYLALAAEESRQLDQANISH